MKKKHVSTVLVAIIACAVSTFLAFNRRNAISDPDLFWHIRAGQYIWESKTIPKSDPFSWTINGADWVAHEWGWQVVLYQLYKLLGWRAVPIIAATTVLLVFLIGVKRDARQNRFLVLVLIALAWVGMIPCVSAARPQNASFVLFALFLDLLINHQNEKYLMWLLPSLEILWVNCHASFVLGPVLVGMFAAFEFFENSGVDHKRFLVVLFLLVTVAAIVNPRGVVMYKYAVDISSDKTAKDYITEWHSPDFHNMMSWLMVGTWLGLHFFAAARVWQYELRELTLVGTSAFLALDSLRHAPYLIITSLFILPAKLASEKHKTEVCEPPWQSWLNIALVAMLIVSAIAGARLNKPDVDNAKFPVEACNWLQGRQADRFRLFNDYNWGGYLIYRGFKVFIDGRADIYLPTGLFNKYAEVACLKSDPEDLLDEYGIEIVLVRADNPLAVWLQMSPEWWLAYSDEVAHVYVRNGVRVQ